MTGACSGGPITKRIFSVSAKLPEAMLTVSVTVAPSDRTAPDATLISPDCVEVNSPGWVVAAMKQLLMLDCPAKGTPAAKSPAGVFAGIVEDFSTSITRGVPLARTGQESGRPQGQCRQRSWPRR